MEQEQEIIETVAVPVIPTNKLTILEKNGIAIEILERIQGFRGMILASVDDKKGYEQIESARKSCKLVRGKIKAACEEGSEDAQRIHKEWVALRTTLTNDVKEVETILESRAKVYEDELERIRQIKLREAQKRVQDRLDELTDLGERPDLLRAQTLSESQWEAFIEPLRSAHSEAIERERVLSESREVGLNRLKLLAEVDVSGNLEMVSLMEEGTFDALLSQARTIWQEKNDLAIEMQHLKTLKDDRYRLRVNALAALEQTINQDDVDAIYEMPDESWTIFLSEETEIYRELQDQKKAQEQIQQEALRRKNLSNDRALLLARAGDLSVYDLNDLADWTQETFDAMLNLRKAQNDTRLAQEKLQKDLDVRWALRRNHLLENIPGFPLGLEINNWIREAEEDVWQIFIDGAIKQRERDERAAREETKRLQYEKADLERLRKEEETRIENDRLARIEAERLANAPDREIVKSWINGFDKPCEFPTGIISSDISDCVKRCIESINQELMALEQEIGK